MRNILVTGGAGYIGSITVRRLLEKGYNVVVYDNLSRGHSASVPQNVSLVQGDIGDSDKVLEVLDGFQIEAVIHFAGFLDVGESVKRPELYFENNVSNGLKFLSVLKSKGIDKIVFSSTCATYGTPSLVPISEFEKQLPINSYGESKLMFERILKWFDHAYNFRSVSLRYFNAAGAAYNIGEAHNPETHLIPLVLEVALKKRDNISIFGTDYSTPDGTCIRDYIHVLDLADVHISALDYLFNGGKTVHLNVGTGKGSSVKEIIQVCRNVTNHPIPTINSARRDGDPPELFANISKAKAILAWEPKFGIKEIIESAWHWHKNNPLGYKK